eukprot:430382_1
MTSVRIPFESYTAQMSQDYPLNSNRNLCHQRRQNEDEMMNSTNHKTFDFAPQITTFSINQVDENDDEYPEEKMHSPRTPYGSVPDRINNNNNNNNNENGGKSSSSMANYPNSMQRTISASSFESVQSYSGNSMSCDHDTLMHYAPPLSATSSLTRGELKAAYSTSTSTSPGGSPCATPKSYKKLRLRASTIDEEEETKEEEEPEEEEKCFGEQNERNEQIEAIHKALTELKTKKQNGFVLYKHGLATYSASNSGANTAGTATPNSIGALSRSSSYGSVGVVSECCFDEENQGKLTDFSEDEMETPVPTSTTAAGAGGGDTAHSPFDFEAPLPVFDANAFGLAQISEDIEDESMVTPNTDRTEEAVQVPPEMMHLEDEIQLKGSRFDSSRVLFLDVDGVLLSSQEQAQLGRGHNIKFNDDVTSLMCKLYRETECDIVVSSTWQFHTVSHLPYLIAYLEACGWPNHKIHTLLDLLPCHATDGINYGREWYEESPYCQARARGIQKIVSLYSNYITRWCCLDDLPLHSQKAVCVPNKDDIRQIVEQVSEAYFQTFSWRIKEKDKLMPDIKYCVQYALTSLPNCIFSSQSYRFGYEYNQTMIYYQADAIAKLCKLTYEIKDNATYQVILQNMMAVLTAYIGANLVYQGDPYIAPYLIQTNQETGITPENIDNAITLLTYPCTTAPGHQLNDANRV